MITDNRELDGAGELARTSKEGAPEQTPISHAAAMPDAESPEGFQERSQIGPAERSARAMALESVLPKHQTANGRDKTLSHLGQSSVTTECGVSSRSRSGPACKPWF